MEKRGELGENTQGFVMWLVEIGGYNDGSTEENYRDQEKLW